LSFVLDPFVDHRPVEHVRHKVITDALHLPRRRTAIASVLREMHEKLVRPQLSRTL
jgi:hypothetical protein